jgi:hypothetical protein
MKSFLWALFSMVLAGSTFAQPTRVALVDFEDLTGQASDLRLGGGIAPGALAAKGVHLLARDLAGRDGYALIDRRDFISQIEKLQPRDAGLPTPTRPTFLQAAQSLRADVILRGSLLSFSTGKQTVDQGGYHTEFSTVSIRVSLQALDARDGAVIAQADGVARDKFRQTAATRTDLSEDDVLQLMEAAIASATAEVDVALARTRSERAQRPTVKINVKTSDDPAMVEIDGILIGTTPITGHEVYQGDHVLTVGKPGYFDVTKRILLERDVAIEVPLIRVQLTADEVKDVLDKARLNIFQGEPGIIIHNLND